MDLKIKVLQDKKFLSSNFQKLETKYKIISKFLNLKISKFEFFKLMNLKTT